MRQTLGAFLMTGRRIYRVNLAFGKAEFRSVDIETLVRHEMSDCRVGLDLLVNANGMSATGETRQEKGMKLFFSRFEVPVNESRTRLLAAAGVAKDEISGVVSST
jgi:hypothetical protein